MNAVAYLLSACFVLQSNVGIGQCHLKLFVVAVLSYIRSVPIDGYKIWKSMKETFGRLWLLLQYVADNGFTIFLFLDVFQHAFLRPENSRLPCAFVTTKIVISLVLL
ncbi:hypothetical protein ERO13_D09G231850v2 [Gossypium hirsutum]|uniref:Uncharacterized protein n=3 Tax=Gossypium TaxID=3633 RepID=A0A5J5Q7A6_GOSBA|nr:hypothetical protein ES319_D09G251700v1 [Gossypium barbadense]KAG4131733.1 hypothetical protein ERO13_D09G231850v2 [Gossypium hirsutum]TYG55430.1 hypothetical protein ES288_D09G272500v1 [Gossypium darwinii]TYI66905.1 hypothetical protein E1A91_D09G260000v1 [Gossypium mustelinum]